MCAPERRRPRAYPVGVTSPSSEPRPLSATALRARLHERLAADKVVPLDAVKRTDLIFNLTRFWNLLGQDSEAAQRRLGWSWAGFRLMNLLWAAGPMESRQLATLSGASRATISSLLGTLERDGLVNRDRSGLDRRQVVVSLTDDGQRRLLDGIRVQSECDRGWFAVLSDDEQDQLNALLTKLVERRRDR